MKGLEAESALFHFHVCCLKSIPGSENCASPSSGLSETWWPSPHASEWVAVLGALSFSSLCGEINSQWEETKWLCGQSLPPQTVFLFTFLPPGQKSPVYFPLSVRIWPWASRLRRQYPHGVPSHLHTEGSPDSSVCVFPQPTVERTHLETEMSLQSPGCCSRVLELSRKTPWEALCTPLVEWLGGWRIS